MKTAKNMLMALIATMSACSLAEAATYNGIVRGDHLNGTIAGRGACVQLAPKTVPGSPWFCNYSEGNNLYNEMNVLLLQAGLEQKYCTIGTTTYGFDGFHKIDYITCPSF